jgi:hypothetical protein
MRKRHRKKTNKAACATCKQTNYQKVNGKNIVLEPLSYGDENSGERKLVVEPKKHHAYG